MTTLLCSKVDEVSLTFKGEVLGDVDIELTRKMCPTWQTLTISPGQVVAFSRYHPEKCARPMMLDQNGDPCITVKWGRETNVLWVRVNTQGHRVRTLEVLY